MKLLNYFVVSIFLFIFTGVSAQETLPIYSDYLSDNIFLVHPAAAGIGNCSKIRFTARNQWSGIDDSPALQTLTVNGNVGKNVGVGLILFNDKNGYHSKQGFEGVVAYHLMLGGRSAEINDLSFGLGLMVINNQLDISDFDIGGDPVFDDLSASQAFFNADFSMAYQYNGFFSYFTAKNLLLTTENYDASESLNLRKYLLTLGYYFGKGKGIEFEPSIMGQYIERTGESFIDFNIQIYKSIQESKLWFAFSYRQGFNSPLGQELQYFTPIIGLNVKNFMLSYTYTKQTGEILFDDAGYHQITLGFNFGCKPREREGRYKRLFLK